MPYCVAFMSAGKVLAPLLVKSELLIHGWLLVYVATIAFILLVLFLFPFLYRKLGPVEPPLIFNSSTDIPEHVVYDKAKRPCNYQKISDRDGSLIGSLPNDTIPT